MKLCHLLYKKIVSEYDQEIPQSQTADNPVAPRGRAAQQSRLSQKTGLQYQTNLPYLTEVRRGIFDLPFFKNKICQY